MVYIKIFGDTGEVASVEALESPVYVYTQPSNGRVLRCRQGLAEGILSADGSCYYQLEGKNAVAGAAALAEVITTAEYEELKATLGTEWEDPEDEDPVVPDGGDASVIMTRAELTEKVNELDEAMELLLSGVTE